MKPDSAKQTREHEQTEVPPLCLVTWFKHDTWTGEQGIQILIGLDPFGTKITTRELHGRNLYLLESATKLDGRTLFDRNVRLGSSSVAEDELARLAIDYEFLKTKWDSGNHPDRNQPRYYIEWALSKGISIPWLNWAETKGYSVADLELHNTQAPNERATDNRPKWEIPGRLECEAREIGQELVDEYRKNKKKIPGVVEIAKHVEKELKQRDRRGPRDDYWDWQTIKREALRGITGRKATGKK
jgi:hypothetical protein